MTTDRRNPTYFPAHSAAATPSAARPTAFVVLPGLGSASPIGGGCCAVGVDDAVQDELESWPGITVEKIDAEAETVTVRFDRDRAAGLTDAVDAVRGLGFPDATLRVL